jgi:hypothetical protein
MLPAASALAVHTARARARRTPAEHESKPCSVTNWPCAAPRLRSVQARPSPCSHGHQRQQGPDTRKTAQGHRRERAVSSTRARGGAGSGRDAGPIGSGRAEAVGSRGRRARNRAVPDDREGGHARVAAGQQRGARDGHLQHAAGGCDLSARARQLPVGPAARAQPCFFAWMGLSLQGASFARAVVRAPVRRDARSGRTAAQHPGPHAALRPDVPMPFPRLAAQSGLAAPAPSGRAPLGTQVAHSAATNSQASRALRLPGCQGVRVSGCQPWGLAWRL